MGWPGERQRHMMSSRGVVTVVAFSGAGERPVTLNRVPPVELSLQVQNQARVDLINSSSTIQTSIIEGARGTFVGFQTRIDYGFDREKQRRGIWPDGDELYNSFDDTRAVLKRQYGPTITLYRLQGEEDIIPNKHTLNWIYSTSFLKQFDRMFQELDEERTLLKREVPIEDIVAVNVGKLGNYEEFVVLNRNSKGLKLPSQLEVVT